MLALILIILRLFVTGLLVVSAFYVASLGFSLGLFFFSTLNDTFFPYLTIMTMCGLFVCTKEESHQLETLLNFACRTVLHKRRDYSASSARKKFGISTLSARRKIHLAHANRIQMHIFTITYLS